MCLFGLQGITITVNTYDTTKNEVRQLKRPDYGKIIWCFYLRWQRRDRPIRNKKYHWYSRCMPVCKSLGRNIHSIIQFAPKKKETPQPNNSKVNLLWWTNWKTNRRWAFKQYHNHMSQFGETPEEVEHNCADMNRNIWVLLVAFYYLSGGNPARQFYNTEILLMHSI
jgi:inosose dehydratase